jgi:hypothetical protein
MTTLHASLIDYRFRMLPLLNMPQSVPPKEKKKGNKPGDDFEDLDDLLHLFEEEDSTFTQNGIIVEPKYDLSEQEKIRERMVRMEKMYSDVYWQPSNITEFFFSDETGCNNISEERIMILYQEFTSIMK